MLDVLGSAIWRSTVAAGTRLPGQATTAQAVARRRAYAIHAYVGPNGAGKSLMAAMDTLPTLAGELWACDNPDHRHTQAGITSGTRKVLSTMRFTTPSGLDHPLWVPLTDFSQIINCEHVDLVLDEVGGAVASSSSDDLPLGVKAALQELRRREVVCRWTAPSWARASKVLRECSQAVTLCLGFAKVAHTDGVRFDGEHHYEELAADGLALEDAVCAIDGPHEHAAGRAWAARRLMYARTFDAAIFEEWTVGKRERQKPEVRHLFWRPGSDAERAYDTHAYVEKLQQVTQSGVCDHCGGTRRRPTCTCDSPTSRRGRSRGSAKPVAAVELELAPEEA